MFYLGIDIGKNTHVATLIDSKKKVLFKAFSFKKLSKNKLLGIKYPANSPAEEEKFTM